MTRGLTFSRKLTFAFVVVGVVLLISTVVVTVLIDRVVDQKNRVIHVEAVELEAALRAELVVAREQAATLTGLLTGSDADFAVARSLHDDFVAAMVELREVARDGDSRTAGLVEAVARAEDAHEAALKPLVEARANYDRPTPEQLGELIGRFKTDIAPLHADVHDAVAALTTHLHHQMGQKEEESDALAGTTKWLAWAAGIVTLLVLGGAALWLSRQLVQTIGSTAQDLAASSKELQVAASQQSTASTQQASVITEATTTLKESVITSQQIRESTQHVARIAEECLRASNSGNDSVGQGHDALGSLNEQMDQIVRQMLDFGEKSRQIGSILDLVNELADQTNILAVNATIEAAGAGEHGVRFSAVASEIRKLADRVSAATREIRGLVEGIRAAVNANVLATEKGQKAADAGLDRFGSVASSFEQISELIVTVTQAAREIELSTKQQASAIEQLSGAFVEAETAAKETEASTRQTVQTADQLSGLSASLLALVRNVRRQER